MQSYCLFFTINSFQDYIIITIHNDESILFQFVKCISHLYYAIVCIAISWNLFDCDFIRLICDILGACVVRFLARDSILLPVDHTLAAMRYNLI